ncbi:response regulator transcription factor [Pelagerythrobacter marensis]|nr:LuxR C-terminal-related transcriptional regulator [Pelagerythrobacter marensis]
MKLAMQVTDVAGGALVHVIDSDTRRRAEVSRELLALGVHAEIYEDAGEFLRMLPARGAVLLVESSEDDLSEFMDSLRARQRYYPVSLYSETPRPERIVRALREGALDYLAWPFDPALFADALRKLNEDGDRQRRIERVRAEARALVEQLTMREREVLVSLLDGNSNKQIAAELDLSPRTVEIYRKNVMRKLGAKSASDAVRIGIYADLWELPVA